VSQTLESQQKMLSLLIENKRIALTCFEKRHLPMSSQTFSRGYLRFTDVQL